MNQKFNILSIKKTKLYYWWKKLEFKKKHFFKIIKLISKNDFKNFLRINQKNKFLSNKKIINLLKSNRLYILVFIYNEDINIFNEYKNKFIYISYFNWKKDINSLNLKKKYLILGFWRNQMEYYHYLKNNNFKIYLQKETK